MQLSNEMREVTIYVCSLCKEPFETNSGLVGHMIAIHINNKDIQSLLQTVAVKSQRKASFVIKTKRNERLHHCTKCPYKVRYLDTIQKHIEKHNKSVTTYSCSFCSYKTVHLINLRLHMKKMHQEHAKEDFFSKDKT